MNKLRAIGLAVVLAASGIITGTTSAEAKPVAEISKEMQSVCIGRHQMDVPRDFEQMMSLTSIFTPPGLTEAGAPIEVALKSARIDRNQFKAEVDKRHAAIKAAQRRVTRVLKEVIPAGNDATLFRILEVGKSYKDELHFWKGGSYLVATTASYDDSYKQAEDRLLAFAANVEPLAPNGRGAGFCLGPVLVKGKYAGEYASFGFRSKAQPDVIVSLELDTYAPDESQPLLKRVNGPDSLLRKFKADNKVMREGELTVAGMRAQEWLSWIKLGSEATRKKYGFAMETMRPAPGEQQPRIHLELDSGQSGPNGESFDNSLDDQSAVALWDSVVKTIRSRPGS